MYQHKQLHITHSVHREIFARFYFCPFCPNCRWANLRHGEFLGEFKMGQTVCKCERAKYTQGENNPVYSVSPDHEVYWTD